MSHILPLSEVVRQRKTQLAAFQAAAQLAQAIPTRDRYRVRSKHTGLYVLACVRSLKIEFLDESIGWPLRGFDLGEEWLAFVGNRAEAELVQFIGDCIHCNGEIGRTFEIVAQDSNRPVCDNCYTLRIKGGVLVTIGVFGGKHICRDILDAKQQERVEESRRRHAKWRGKEFVACEFIHQAAIRWG